MKRREFLASSASLAGGLLPAFAAAQVAPCPPPSVSVSGGSSATGSCRVDAASDWLARCGGSGVQWYHDFTSESEFTDWRCYDISVLKNYPDNLKQTYLNALRREPRGGYGGGGALVMEHLATPQGYQPIAGSWERPFGAMPGDPGYRQGDRYIPEQYRITPDPWTNQQNVVWLRRFRGGLYGHSSYHARTNPFPKRTDWPLHDQQLWDWQWKGDEYWLQYRVWIDEARFAPENWTGGVARKAFYIDLGGNGNAEFVLLTPHNDADPITGQPFNRHMHWYTGSFGTGFNTPNGPAPNVNTPSVDLGSAWSWPTNRWVTVMIHHKVGKNARTFDLGDSSGTAKESYRIAAAAAGYNDSTVEIHVADQGAKDFTLVYRITNKIWDFDAKMEERDGLGYPRSSWPDQTFGPPAINCFMPTMYNNNQTIKVPFVMKYSQVIFSKERIACPQV